MSVESQPAAASLVAAAPEAAPEARCRNCGSPIGGSYCATCGQETVIALPAARAFLREAAGRYVALDGRLWRTLFALLFRPGFLTREYLHGRRRRYIRPARLFLILSLFLFAVLRFGSSAPLVVADDRKADTDRAAATKDADEGGEVLGMATIDPDLNVQLNFSGASWLAPLRSRIDAFNRLSRQDKIDQIFAGTTRYGPYAMFALLPVFALLMKIVYLGRRRRYPDRPGRYAAHLVFGAHNHAFLFLGVALASMTPVAGLRDLLVLWILVYGLWATKVVYGGRWSGVVLRALVVALVYLVCFGLAMGVLVIAAIALR